MVKLSVVMAAYDAGPLLVETIDSILGQTFQDFELVLVDDGSPEPLAVANHPKIRLIRHEENLGLTRALVTGCAAAAGDYIARHDAQDLSYPTRFEREVELLDSHPELTFVSCHTQFAGPGREPLYVSRGSGLASEPRAILDPAAEHGVLDGPTSHGSVMFRRDAYLRAGGYRPEFYYGQDWDLWYRLASLGSFQMVDAILYEMRVMPDGITAQARSAQSSLSRLSYQAMQARMAGRSDEEVLEAASLIRKAPPEPCSYAGGLYFIGEMLRRNRDPRSRRYLARAIQRCPFLLRAWIRLAQSLFLR